MFGYIRPMKSELKVREFEQFKSCYCSLCHVLGKNYGLSSQFILNYDFLFLAMLLWNGEETLSIDRLRCIASPCRRKCVCRPSASFDRCAGYSVILSYWKVRDSLADERGGKKVKAVFSRLMLSGSYRKAKKRWPEFDRAVTERLTELSGLEKAGEPSLDRTADCFASLLAAAAEEGTDEETRRILGQILYHTGRWIYLTDAYGDLKEDLEKKQYNPVAARYGLKTPEVPASVREEMRITLESSAGTIRASFELLPETIWSGILRNIIYLGMADTQNRVLNGTFRMEPGRLPK